LNLPAELFTADNCFPHDYGESIEGKVVAIRPEIMSPEYNYFAILMQHFLMFGIQNPFAHASYFAYLFHNFAASHSELGCACHISTPPILQYIYCNIIPEKESAVKRFFFYLLL